MILQIVYQLICHSNIGLNFKRQLETHYINNICKIHG
jgi:hypothetical protein